MYTLLSIESQGPIQYEQIVQKGGLVAIPNHVLILMFVRYI